MKMRIAFVCDWDANDPNSASGAAYGIRQALIAEGHEVCDVFPIKKDFRARAVRFLTGLASKYYKAKGFFYSGERERLYRNVSASVAAGMLRRFGPVDAIFAQSSVPVTRLKTDVPIYSSTDQTFMATVRDYLENPAKRFVDCGTEQMNELGKKIAGLFVPSLWAAEEFSRLYGVPLDRITIAPWGANLPSVPDARQVEEAIAARAKELSDGEIRFVFIGKDWDRKGGAVIDDTLKLLKAQGRNIKLDVIGPKYDLNIGLPHTHHGFMDKSNPEEFSRLGTLMLKAHFFFMPSRAEAYGHVYCEAAAFGVPSIAADVGGVSSIIINGNTGICLPLAARPEDYAKAILDACSSPVIYSSFAQAARNRYEAVLNWKAYARAVTQRIAQDLETADARKNR